MNTALAGAALAVLAAAAQGPLAVDTLRPIGGPEVLWHRHASPVVALRLSAHLDPNLPRGAAALLQELARPDAAAAANRIGAALDLRIAGDEAVISVAGPAAAFDALVAILRRAAAEPVLSVAALPPARARAEDRILAALERPVPRLRAILRARLLGREPRGADLGRLDPEQIRSLAALLYDPARLRVVLVGDPPPEIVRSAFAWWPRHGAPPAMAVRVDSAPPLPRPQAHHAWAGLAFPVDADPGAVAVAAALVHARIQAAGLRLGRAEAWSIDGHGALVLLGGAPVDDPAVTGAARITAFHADDDDDVSALARFLRRMVAEAAALAAEDDVDRAAAALRHAIMRQTRTAAGRAAVLGEWSELEPGTGTSVHDVLAGLNALMLDDVRAVLGDILSRPAIVAEVRP